MSNNKDTNSKQKRNDHVLKNLPTEVLLKARSTLVSLGGALKPRQEQQQRPKLTKQESKDKKTDKLKNSRSEPEFSEVRKNKHRSRVDECFQRDQDNRARPRPLSVGATKRHEKEIGEFSCGSFTKEDSLIYHGQFESSEDVCVQSRLVIPVNERLSNQDLQSQDLSERPRKKLSFREPEIVGGGSATLGRSHKLMGVNSLAKRPNRLSLRSETHYSSLEGLDSDLESQAMRIVRTVGQAFEVCHKMQINSASQPVASTSSAVDDQALTDQASDAPPSKEAASDCGASESGAASSSKLVAKEDAEEAEDHTRPKHLELLPPPPRKNGNKLPLRITPAPSINLPDLPECVTKVEMTSNADDATTPLSAQHQLQLLHERLEQQAQQTRAAVAQLLLLRDQLAAEQSARCEAQARTHQLLVHNKELLEHIAALVAHLQERERGSSRPISAQQLTLLPQSLIEGGVGDAIKTENFARCNGNRQQSQAGSLINLISQGTQVAQNMENNNVRLSPFCVSPNIPGTPVNGPTSAPTFGGMSNEQIQNYLISKFQNISFENGADKPNVAATNNQQYFQNTNAFPNIPPLTNHFSNTDLASLTKHQAYKEILSSAEEISVTQPMSVGQSEKSLCSNSQATTSKDSTPDSFSSDDGVPFIMPLSHNGTLKATGEDGRVRLIVPVSPSGSSSDVAVVQTESQAASGMTLKVPGPDRFQTPAGPITRTTSEKVPNRSEMMTALRSQWTRHTTK